MISQSVAQSVSQSVSLTVSQIVGHCLSNILFFAQLFREFGHFNLCSFPFELQNTLAQRLTALQLWKSNYCSSDSRAAFMQMKMSMATVKGSNPTGFANAKGHQKA